MGSNGGVGGSRVAHLEEESSNEFRFSQDSNESKKANTTTSFDMVLKTLHYFVN